MSIKERVLVFISSKNIPISEFERRCSLSNGYISSMRKGFGTEKLDNVLNEFPELNRDWLLYGDGDMFNSPDNSESGILKSALPQGEENCSPDALKEEGNTSKFLALLAKKDEQMDKLISVIEKLTNNLKPSL